MTARTTARDVECPTCGIAAGLPCRSLKTGLSNTDTHKARRDAAAAPSVEIDLDGPLFGELCAGYGGIGMGAQTVLGGRMLWYAEWDDDPSRIMAHHHPDAVNYRDVTAIDWHNVPRVDVLTAGFPCQPFSHAGKRLGANDERHLWPHIAHGISIMRPQLVILENVRGLASGQGEPDTDEIVALDARRQHIDRALVVIERRRRKAIRENATQYVRRHTDDSHRLMVERRRIVARAKRARAELARALATVLGDLADLGYDAQWYGLRAADVGATHGRFRFFIYAWPADAPSDPRWVGYGDAGAAAAHAASSRGKGDRAEGLEIAAASTGAALPRRDDSRAHAVALLPTPEAKLGSAGPDYARVNRDGSGGDDLTTAVAKLLPTPRASDGDKGGPNQRGSSGDLMLPSAVLFPTPVTSDREGGRRRRRDGTPYGTAGHMGQTLTDATTLLPTPSAADSLGGHTSRSGDRGDELLLGGVAKALADDVDDSGQDWGEYGPAVRRWEAVVGRRAPSPTELGGKGQARLSPAFVEWMMGLPAGHVTDPAIWDDGRSESQARNAQLKALGNGVVPQQCAAATWAFVQDMLAEHTTKAASA